MEHPLRVYGPPMQYSWDMLHDGAWFPGGPGVGGGAPAAPLEGFDKIEKITVATTK